jgi:hypothetical protein
MERAPAHVGFVAMLFGDLDVDRGDVYGYAWVIQLYAVPLYAFPLAMGIGAGNSQRASAAARHAKHPNAG